LEIGFSTATVAYVACGNDYFARVPMNGGELKIQRRGPEEAEPFVTFAVDPRLLARILKGPRYAHWNNAEIGSHIWFDRRPDKFDRALHHCMNFFHA
jgi:UDP-MurNAc hydroxylase